MLWRCVDDVHGHGASRRADGGALAVPIGAPATVAFGGTVCVLGGLIFGSRLPALRGPARDLIATQQVSAGAPPDEALRADS